MDQLLPVLVAQLADADAAEVLEAVSFTNGVAVVPLADAPIDASRHVLEVWVPDAEHPSLFFAEPAGAPTDAGFPLRLSPYDLPDEDDEAPTSIRRPPPASDRHPTGRGLDAPGAPDRSPYSMDAMPQSGRAQGEEADRSDGDDPEPKTVPARRPSQPPTFRGKERTNPASVSAHHAAELAGKTSSGRTNREDLVGQAVANGKYVFLELLGEGGIGKVYKARHRDLRKNVAVKVLHPSFQTDLDFCSSFYGEALAASALDHPNIVRVLDFGQEPDGMLYIVMELIAGRTLGTLLRTKLPTVQQIAEIMMQVCAGLQMAHEHGIVHRDIKPENVMLVPGHDDDGKELEIAKICDFGIAQHRVPDVAPDDHELVPREVDYRVAGTPEYMSPEQCLGSPLDERSDVYSCGVMLYELATGRLPFTDPNANVLLRKHLEDVPTPPSRLKPDMDPLLESIILKALRKDPAERQQTMRELRAELKELLEPILVEAPPSAPMFLPAALTRREVLDVSALPKLEEPAAGFQEMFVSFAAAISRTGYYERGHPEADVALDRLARTMDVTLKHRGEISFARRDIGARIEFSVLSGVGEVHELRKLIPPGVAGIYEAKLGEVFVRRNIVSITIVDGITPEELGHVIELLSGPEISKQELRAQLDRLRLSHTKALLAEDLLGRDRRLAWQVDLCISRLARDLRSLPLLRDVDDERMRQLRVQLISDVVRALSRPEHVQALMMNTDLVEREVSQLPEYSGLDWLAAFVEAIPRGRLLMAANLMLAFTQDAKVQVALTKMAAKFARDRSGETDTLLRELYKRGVLSRTQLPPDLLAWVHAEQRLEQVLADPAGALGAIAAIEDVQRFAAEISVLERVIQSLARRNETAALTAVVRMLEGVAHTGSDRAAIAMRALRAAEAPGNLTSIAEQYLVGPAENREGAKALLVRGREAGALALYAARAKATDPGARPRFVAAMREIGKRAWPAIWGALQKLPPLEDPAFDAELAEDLLRSVPDVVDEHAGSFVSRLVRQGPPGVAKAAVGALVSLWGPRARPLLVGVLDQGDDGVRMAALSALRRMRGLDENVLSRIDRILGRAVPGGDELRALAAGALADIPSPLRPAAIAILKRTVARKGAVVSFLRAATGHQESAPVIVACSRVLLAIGGADGRTAVEERAERSDDTLRDQLYELLGAGAP